MTFLKPGLYFNILCDKIKGNESHVGNIQFWFLNINHLPIQNATFGFKPHLNRRPTSGYRDMNNSLKFKNNMKHKNLSPILACNPKLIFPTSDSFPLIMSHIEGSESDTVCSLFILRFYYFQIFFKCCWCQAVEHTFWWKVPIAKKNIDKSCFCGTQYHCRGDCELWHVHDVGGFVGVYSVKWHLRHCNTALLIQWHFDTKPPKK